MANFPGLQMTAAGRDLQAKAQTGVQLNFSRVAIGNGAMPADYEPLTSLVSEKKSLDLAGFELLGDGTSKLKVLLTNEGVAEGFFIREIGVFAIDPDTSTEILYSYSNADQYIDYLPAFGGATIVEMTFELYTVVGNASNITATINDYLVHATKADVDELRPYVLPVGGDVDHLLRKRSNLEGDTEWFNPTEGIQIRINSVTEERTAVEGQTAFALTKTLTNGLAVYVNGKRIPNSKWSAIGGSQVVLDDPLSDGDKVQFINNEEVGTVTLSRVSLDGPDLVYPGTSNDYTITDYDRFSNYSVSTSVGTASHADGVITLIIPANATVNDGIILTVQRNGGGMSFSIALGDQAIAQPQITSPEHNATDVGETPTIAVSAFQTYPANADTQVSATWRISTNAAMTNIIWQSVNDAVNLTAITIPRDVLSESTVYYIDVLYTGGSIGNSVRSSVITFETTDRFMEILRPSIIAPSHNSLGIGETPTITARPFQVYPANADTQVSATWRVSTNAAMTNIVFQVIDDTQNLESITIPDGILEESTTYYVDVVYTGEILGDSEHSVLVAFTTANQYLPSVIGEPWGGGYYAGRMSNGYFEYVLIVSPRSQGEAFLKFKTSKTADSGAWSTSTGLSNTNNLSDNEHPAAQFCHQLSASGYNDWYCPSLDELEVLYRNLKPTTQQNLCSIRPSDDQLDGQNSNSAAGAPYSPTNPHQTLADEFIDGGVEAFAQSFYWTSTRSTSATGMAFVQNFSDGDQTWSSKTDSHYVRAIRNIPII